MGSEHMATQAGGQQYNKPIMRVGSKLLKDAFSGSGVLLLRAGQQIQTIAELHRLVQPDVRFGKERSAEVPLDIENELALDAALSENGSAPDSFESRVCRAVSLKAEAIQGIKDVFENVAVEGKVNLDRAHESVSALLNDMLQDPVALVSLVRLKDADTYTYIHSVHVAILAMFIAMNTGYEADIENIGMGALLHDVGKSAVPVHLLTKTGPLNRNEKRIIAVHPEAGARLLVDSGFSDSIGLSCVRDHHEKMSGGGYPRGIKNDAISPYAMITALADIYDALTSDRPYRKAMSPKDALLVMTQQMGQDLHPRLLQRFVQSVGYFPVGSLVLLTTGSRATVIRNNPTDPLRPTVQLDSPSGPKGESKTIDLSCERNLFIKQFLVQRTGLDLAREAA